MSEREEFEKVFPVPKGCEWSDALSQYCWLYIATVHQHDALWMAWQAARAASPKVPQGFPPFAEKILTKLRRVEAHFRDGQDADIGSHWLDVLVLLGLLNRVQRSPAKWEITQQGEDFLAEQKPQALPQGAEEWIAETMRQINELTPCITDKGLNPSWIVLRQHLESIPCAAAPEGMAIVPVDDMPAPVRGIVTGVLSVKKVVEISLDKESYVPEAGEAVYISGNQLLRSIGVSGEGHNADWCAGWNACLLVSTSIEPVTYSAMLAATKEKGE